MRFSHQKQEKERKDFNREKVNNNLCSSRPNYGGRQHSKCKYHSSWNYI
jgi:hypothetical protein